LPQFACEYFNQPVWRSRRRRRRRRRRKRKWIALNSNLKLAALAPVLDFW